MVECRNNDSAIEKTINALVENLQKNISTGMSLEEIIKAFKNMCEIPVEDDMILFESGIETVEKKKLFCFSLIRQISDSEGEYYQIHADILYEPDRKNKRFRKSIWNEDLDENIFDYIQKMKAYKYLCNIEYTDIEIFVDQT